MSAKEKKIMRPLATLIALSLMAIGGSCGGGKRLVIPHYTVIPPNPTRFMTGAGEEEITPALRPEPGARRDSRPVRGCRLANRFPDDRHGPLL